MENKLPEREQAILDTALLESDQLLVRSLHDDDQRRRRRRWYWLLATVLGGVVMSGLLFVVFSGWLAIGGQVVADRERPSASEQSQQQLEQKREQLQWEQRLTAVTDADPWSVSAQIGMDLVRIPGDFPYKILAAHWDRIAVNARKQILKGFTPGMMGNKKLHSRFFDVMDLGMSDEDSEVRSFAANYLKMQGLPDYEHDLSLYRRWRRETKGLTAQAIAALNTGKTDTAPAAPESGDQLTVEGWELWKQQKYSAAVEKFAAAVKVDSQASEAWNGLGWSRFNGGDSEQAVAAFEKCVALEPKHPAALNGLGQIYLMWKEYDRAEKYLLLAAPHAPAAWYGLARVYLLQDKFAEAQPWAEKIAAQNPSDEGAKQMLTAAQAGKLDDSFRRQIEPAGKPTGNSADAVRGWAMFQQGKMSTAERFFRRALKEDDQNLSALNGLAFCLLNLGKHEQAQPLFEKYLAQEKDAAGPMNGLARCLRASGKVDEAIALWERMAKKYPGPTAAAAGLAMTYLERKQYAKAVEYYQILVDADGANKQYQNGLKRAQAGLAKSQ